MLDQVKTANFTVEGDLNINLLDVTNKNVEEYAINGKSGTKITP